MQGNLNNTNPLELLQALGNRNSPGLLRIRPGDEAQIYVAANGITHAAYRTLSGVDALVEITTWRNDEFRFEENNFSFTRSLTLAISEAVSKLNTAAALRDLRPRDATGSMYFYSQRPEHRRRALPARDEHRATWRRCEHRKPRAAHRSGCHRDR
ncbi:MAG: DUF4388 domain-containing protein [Pleurocapsa sp. SU_196_0]|nr:DUF4388 domain-containing protein [Pleurocapsa sp. SU_196_0]